MPDFQVTFHRTIRVEASDRIGAVDRATDQLTQYDGSLLDALDVNAEELSDDA